MAPDRPACIERAHALPVLFYRRGDSWAPSVGHALIGDGQSFDEVLGVLTSNPPRQLRCRAPQLEGLLTYGNSPSQVCNAVRDFECACCAEGKWFRQRVGRCWSYQSVKSPGGNNGQFEDAQLLHIGVPEQSSGTQKGGCAGVPSPVIGGGS